MRDGVEHTERHHAASSWGIGGEDEPIESFELLCQPGAE